MCDCMCDLVVSRIDITIWIGDNSCRWRNYIGVTSSGMSRASRSAVAVCWWTSVIAGTDCRCRNGIVATRSGMFGIFLKRDTIDV